jgi:hypothetical protein
LSELVRWLPSRRSNLTALRTMDWATNSLFSLLFSAAFFLRRANVALRSPRT